MASAVCERLFEGLVVGFTPTTGLRSTLVARPATRGYKSGTTSAVIGLLRSPVRRLIRSQD